MKHWLRVTRDGDKVILEVFPLEAGGATLYLSTEEAIWLAGLLNEAALPDAKGD